jgi:hypothetical protein
MKISIITRHAPSNYGSLLQAIATQKIIQSLGHKASIINYIRKDECGLKGVTTLLKYKKEWENNIFKKILYILLRYPSDKYAEIKFSRMRKRNLDLTPRFSSHIELKEASFIKETDVFLTGSDQVWGPVADGKPDSAYFLSFTPHNSYKVSYAGSFGKTEFNESTLALYKEWLKDYNHITIREDSAVDILKKLELPCFGQVLDPTLLITAEEWSQFITQPTTQKPYVLVYQIHNNPILDQYAIAFAKKANLPLYRISPSLHQIKRGGKFIYLPEIGDFISYIKNATYIITDSFHGTAFSINFNKNFIEILPNTKTGTRNQSILKLTKLEKRIITNYNDFSLMNQPIDYSEVNKIIKQERAKSINILERIINNYKKEQ